MPNKSGKLPAKLIKDQRDTEFAAIFIHYKWGKSNVLNEIKAFSNTPLICLYTSPLGATFLEKLILYQRMKCSWKL